MKTYLVYLLISPLYLFVLYSFYIIFIRTVEYFRPTSEMPPFREDGYFYSNLIERRKKRLEEFEFLISNPIRFPLLYFSTVVCLLLIPFFALRFNLLLLHHYRQLMRKRAKGEDFVFSNHYAEPLSTSFTKIFKKGILYQTHYLAFNQVYNVYYLFHNKSKLNFFQKINRCVKILLGWFKNHVVGCSYWLWRVSFELCRALDSGLNADVSHKNKKWFIRYKYCLIMINHMINENFSESRIRAYEKKISFNPLRFNPPKINQTAATATNFFSGTDSPIYISKHTPRHVVMTGDFGNTNEWRPGHTATTKTLHTQEMAKNLEERKVNPRKSSAHEMKRAIFGDPLEDKKGGPKFGQAASIRSFGEKDNSQLTINEWYRKDDLENDPRSIGKMSSIVQHSGLGNPIMRGQYALEIAHRMYLLRKTNIIFHMIEHGRWKPQYIYGNSIFEALLNANCGKLIRHSPEEIAYFEHLADQHEKLVAADVSAISDIEDKLNASTVHRSGNSFIRILPGTYSNLEFYIDEAGKNQSQLAYRPHFTPLPFTMRDSSFLKNVIDDTSKIVEKSPVSIESPQTIFKLAGKNYLSEFDSDQ
jgi:hypothetical protein